MAILVNKPSSVSANSTTSLELNKADLQAKLEALNAGAYWEDQNTWKGVAFLFENLNKQKVTVSFDASGNTANLNVSEFFVDGSIQCKRIDVIGFANDYYTIYRSNFDSASEFDVEINNGYASGGTGGGGAITPTVLINIPALSGVNLTSASGNIITSIPNTIIEQGVTYRYDYTINPSSLLTLPPNISTISNITVPIYLQNNTSWVPVNTIKIVAEIYELVAVNANNSDYLGLMTPVNGALPVFTSEIPITELGSNTQEETFIFNTNLNTNKRYGLNFAIKVPQTDYALLNAQTNTISVRMSCVDAYSQRVSVPQLTNYVQKNSNNVIFGVYKNANYNWVYAQTFYTNFIPAIKLTGTSI